MGIFWENFSAQLSMTDCKFLKGSDLMGLRTSAFPTEYHGGSSNIIIW